MTVDPLRQIAEQVADCFSADGYAFIEADKLEYLTAALRAFLIATDIPVDQQTGARHTPLPAANGDRP